MKTSEGVDKISAAMATVQGKMRAAAKDSKNPFFKSNYSNLASIWNACREPLTTEGLSVWQDVTSDETSVGITTRIAHSSGQWYEVGPLHIPLVKKDAQSVGSAIAYGKRYHLGAAVGVVSDEDDDGEGAQGRGKVRTVIEEAIQAPKLPQLELDMVMAAAKKAWGGKGFTAKQISTHLDGISKGLGDTSLAHLSPDHIPAALDAIANGSNPS